MDDLLQPSRGPTLLEGFPVTVKVMPEATIFPKNEPVVRISGRYRVFPVRGNNSRIPLPGPGTCICRCSDDTCLIRPFCPFLCFTPQVPSTARMIGQTTWIDGAERVSEHLFSGNIPAIGTMPHAFVLSHTKPEVAKAHIEPAPLPLLRKSDSTYYLFGKYRILGTKAAGVRKHERSNCCWAVL